MRLNLKRPLVFFDLESTGTNVQEDRICQLAVIKIMPDGSRMVIDRMLNPTIPIPTAASAIHGITDEMVKDCQTFADRAILIYNFLKDCDIAGYNSNDFDIPLLMAEFARVGLTWDVTDVLFLDASVIFKRQHPRNLAAAYKTYCNKEMGEGEAHNAKNDILATEEVFFAQLEQHDDLPQTIEELALYCNYDKVRCDVARRFTLDENGQYVFTFGKHKGRLAKLEPEFLEWMLGVKQNFMPDTKDICYKILNELQQEADAAKRDLFTDTEPKSKGRAKPPAKNDGFLLQ